MEEKTTRGYKIIEPAIYEELNWNMDSIVSCLEIIRTKLPELFTEFPKSIKYEIIPLGNPFGEPYPVIGLYSDNLEDLKKIPDFLDLDEEVEIWLNKIGIETIRKESEKIKVMSWETLKNINTY
ncbi:hypothetical protein [Tenacibaculum caenipelagi]|uniref:Uncharacterized protein n=1 Tax=Tenacibaculum caenipelagi TaxID=1325435 RepID=A0A4R6TFD0_9FLAO|nr:hypothetical protein [Tenacibaculum caenipelagi]TDQ25725.1 hypothetical protein DFQ07_2155 [Tenacibaculum caenipelagi]